MSMDPAGITAERLALAYLATFQEEGGRDTDREIVMADLEYQGFMKRPVHMQRSAEDGELTLQRGVFNDGRRSIVLHIQGQIARAQRTPAEAPKVSREKKSEQSIP